MSEPELTVSVFSPTPQPTGRLQAAGVLIATADSRPTAVAHLRREEAIVQITDPELTLPVVAPTPQPSSQIQRTRMETSQSEAGPLTVADLDRASSPPAVALPQLTTVVVTPAPDMFLQRSGAGEEPTDADPEPAMSQTDPLGHEAVIVRAITQLTTRVVTPTPQRPIPPDPTGGRATRTH